MSICDDDYPDLLRGVVSPQRRRLVAHLDAIYTASILPAEHDLAIARVLQARATVLVERGRMAPTPALWIQHHRALACGTMLALALFVSATYAALHGRATGLLPTHLTPTITSTAATSPTRAPLRVQVLAVTASLPQTIMGTPTPPQAADSTPTRSLLPVPPS